MIYLVTVIHVVVSLFLIFVVLIQSGKSSDVAAAFGGMGSQTAFGPRGSATVLTKATTYAAIIFMLTSITLSIYASRQKAGGTSVLEGAPAQSQPAPASNPITPIPRQQKNFRFANCEKAPGREPLSFQNSRRDATEAGRPVPQRHDARAVAPFVLSS
jgi:preprotein translocase subunit SecG